jgi:hypothetical protein
MNQIRFLRFDYNEDSGTVVFVNGEQLFYDGEFTYNCIKEILTALDIECEVVYDVEEEFISYETKRMMIVPEAPF